MDMLRGWQEQRARELHEAPRPGIHATVLSVEVDTHSVHVQVSVRYLLYDTGTGAHTQDMVRVMVRMDTVVAGVGDPMGHIWEEVEDELHIRQVDHVHIPEHLRTGVSLG
jgi:hypothetical protein